MIKAIIFDFYGVLYRDEKLDENLINFVENLKPKYKVAIISNIGRTTFDRVMPDNVQKLFDVIALSGETDYFKPYPEAFLEAVRYLGVKPEDCVMIDDTPVHVDSARLIGMYGILYRSLDQLKVELDAIVESTQR